MDAVKDNVVVSIPLPRPVFALVVPSVALVSVLASQALPGGGIDDKEEGNAYAQRERPCDDEQGNPPSRVGTVSLHH